jgi:hypothetical protein
MPLTITDFVEQSKNISSEDIPDEVEQRINDQLADLTGGQGENPVPINENAILVSKSLGDREGSESIQAGIDSAESGDTILVEPGTYAEKVYISKDDLTLRSSPGPDQPVIEFPAESGEVQGKANQLVEIRDASGVTVDGFDIDLAGGKVVYANPGEGLSFLNNSVTISPTSDHGIRMDDSGGAPTVVQRNEFTFPNGSDGSVNSQAILFSGGSDYVIEDNVLNGPGKDAPSPDDANIGILISVPADTSGADVLDNDISGFNQGIFLFENPPDENISDVLIENNEISSVETGIRADDLDEDGSGFTGLNGVDDDVPAQQTALENANTFAASSVDTDVQIIPTPETPS